MLIQKNSKSTLLQSKMQVSFFFLVKSLRPSSTTNKQTNKQSNPFSLSRRKKRKLNGSVVRDVLQK